ncbi:MAG: PVC-type heme-binding CxxCH protein [Pirellulales bacterium]
MPAAASTPCLLRRPQAAPSSAPRRVPACPLVFVVVALVAPFALAQQSPEAELKTLRAATDLDVSLFASEPLITNPAAIDVDAHGRVWVAEIQWYRAGAKTPPADKIKVLEDTDGDGRADKVTVFAEGLFAPMSICVAGDKVFVATSPDLWQYEDKNGDLVADGPPRKLLSGFGGHNHDHGAHSLVLGPDHKWWMSHGDAGFDVTGSDGSHIAYQWGAVMRGELDGSQLELVSVNFRNPYEVCVSSFGEAYLSDNDNDGNESVRICWLLEGGNYGWFGGPPFAKQDLAARLSADTPGREHWHFRGHVPGYVPGTLITGFGSPTGICFYEGGALGPKYENAPLHTDAGPRECRVYRHEPAGFGMRATSETFLSNRGDDYFRPDDICAGPDAALYVSDWYDGGVGGHGYNNPDQGRIFLLKPKGKALARHDKPGPYANLADAMEALKSPNLATQFLAREYLLAAGSAGVAALKQLVADGAPNDRARALWLLDRLGGDARGAVVEQLHSSDATFRALAVRILRRHGREHERAILALAADGSPEVRREVLLAAAHWDSESALDAIAGIAATYDGTDRYQLEAIHIAATGPADAAGEERAARRLAVLARLEKSAPLSPAQFPLLELLAPERAAASLLARLAAADLEEKSARQLLDSAVNMAAPEAGWALLTLATDARRPPALRRRALERVLANVDDRQPWSSLVLDERFAKAIADLAADAALRPLALRAIGRLHLTALAPQVTALAQSSAHGPSAQAQAIRVAARLRSADIAGVLLVLVADPNREISQAALDGLLEVQDVRTLRELFGGERFSSDVRRAAVEKLVDSTGGALVLLRLIDDHVLAADLARVAVAKAVTHPDANVRVLFEKFVPADQRPKKLGQAITADAILSLAGDTNRGREIFFKSSAAQCKSCHAVQGFGSGIGPELTHIGKKYERQALLETILDPSKAIAPEFRLYLLETTGGMVFAGFLVERNADQVVLQDIKGGRIRVPTDEIEALVEQPKSLMPELVLSEVTAQDAADLLEFLTTLK